MTYTVYNYEHESGMEGLNMLSQPLIVAVGDQSSAFSTTLPTSPWGTNISSYLYSDYDNISGRFRLAKTVRWYDQDADKQVDYGELYNSSVSPTTEFTSYDTYGNVLVQKDLRGMFTYYYYGSPYIACTNDPPTNELRHAYLTCVKNELGQENRLIYGKAHTYDDYLVGYTIDENNQYTYYLYDALGRVLSIRPPGMNIPLNEYEYYYAKDHGVLSSINPNYIRVKTHIDSFQISDALKNYDGLGKEINTSTLDLDSQNITVQKLYNPVGLLEKESTSYKKGAGSPQWKSVKYENSPLLRPVRNYPLGEDPDNSSAAFILTTYAASPDNQYMYTTVRDEKGIESRTITDKLGRTVSITAALGTSDEANTTTRHNDIAGQSIDVINPMNQTTGTRADSLQRVRVLQNPDSGLQRNLKYDLAGQVIVTGEGCSGSIESFASSPSAYDCQRMTGTSYDRLGRLSCVKYGLTENDADAWNGTECTGAHVRYYYDSYDAVSGDPCYPPSDPTINYSVGRLTGIKDTYNKANAYKNCVYYDNRGLVREETRIIDGVDYAMYYKYDDAGNLIKFTYPTGEYVKYDYDSLIRLRGVNYNNKVFNPSFEYSPLGNLTLFAPNMTKMGWGFLAGGGCTYTVHAISSDAKLGRKSLHFSTATQGCGVYQVINEGIQNGEKFTAYIKVTAGNLTMRLANSSGTGGPTPVVVQVNNQYQKKQLLANSDLSEIKFYATDSAGVDAYIDVVEVTSNTNSIFSSESFEYNSDGTTKEHISGNGVITNYSYTPRQWVGEIASSGFYYKSYSDPNGPSIDREFRESYQYDKSGNLEFLEEWEINEDPYGDTYHKTKYTYDSLYRLKSALPMEIGGRYYQMLNYTYDAAGNMLSMNNVQFSMNGASNQLANMTVDTGGILGMTGNNYTYDSYGNLINETGWQEVEFNYIRSAENASNEYWLYGIDAPVNSTIRVVYLALNSTFATDKGPRAWDNVLVEAYNGSQMPYWDSQQRYATYARISLSGFSGVADIAQFYKLYRLKTTNYCFDQGNRLLSWFDTDGECMKFMYAPDGTRIQKTEKAGSLVLSTDYVARGNNIIYEKTYADADFTCPQSC